MKEKLRELKEVGKKALATVAVVGMLNACGEPKIEYRDVPCTDPTHGTECTDNHVDQHTHDNCYPQCEHSYPVCQAKSVSECYLPLTTALRNARLKGIENCGALGCKTGGAQNKCDSDLVESFTNKAFSLGDASGRSLHNVSGITLNFDNQDPVVAREAYDFERKYAPCLTSAEIQQAYDHALASVEHTID